MQWWLVDLSLYTHLGITCVHEFVGKASFDVWKSLHKMTIADFYHTGTIPLFPSLWVNHLSQSSNNVRQAECYQPLEVFVFVRVSDKLTLLVVAGSVTSQQWPGRNIIVFWFTPHLPHIVAIWMICAFSLNIEVINGKRNHYTTFPQPVRGNTERLQGSLFL